MLGRSRRLLQVSIRARPVSTAAKSSVSAIIYSNMPNEMKAQFVEEALAKERELTAKERELWAKQELSTKELIAKERELYAMLLESKTRLETDMLYLQGKLKARYIIGKYFYYYRSD